MSPENNIKKFLNSLILEEKKGGRNKKRRCKASFFVGVPGLEPGKAGPESAVLPLHHTPIDWCNFRIAGAKVHYIFELPKLLGDFLLKYSKKVLCWAHFSD